MFIRPSVIDSLLKCNHCFKNYSVYEQPRILPCCGKTLCSKCLLLIEKEIKNNKFKCMLCNEQSIVPAKGFLFNEMAIKLLSEQPVDVYRGIETEKLKKNITELDQLTKKLLFEINNVELSVDDHFKEQERLVQLTTEEMIEEIYKRRDVLLQQLSERRRVCINNSAKLEKFQEKTNKIANQVNKQLEKDRAYLNQLQLDDNSTAASNDKLALLKCQVERERFEIKKALFNGHLMQFNPAKRETDGENIIGSFDFDKIYLKKTVNI